MRKSPRFTTIGRRTRRQFRLGRDFVFAVFLLLLGIGLPLATAATDQHTRAIVRRALTSAIRNDPATIALLPMPTNTAIPINLDAAPAIIATLPPIEPTIAVALPAQTNQELSALSTPAPILMYHYIRSVDASVDPLGYELSVTPALFMEHMAWLDQHGYHGIRVDTMIRCMQGEPICPPQPVVISFDDGYQDAYTEALPILQQYEFQATFYIATAFIGQPAYMNWDQVAALRDAGMEIGAHTIDHQMLTRLEFGEMQRQIAQSKLDLERQLGIAVTSFCYPVGDYDGTVVEQVRAAGFRSAVTTRWDNNYADLLTLPRRRVAGGTTAEELGWIISS
jgi:peptidoglycan/xylan/chitin deacetylase (PgdA/CDA1 family)